MSKTNSRVALIVGAGTATGAEIARKLAAEGTRVALNDLLPTRIEPLAEELGSGAAAFAADVSRKLSLQTMLQDVLAAYERIDILVFIASVRPDDPLLDMDEWDWHRTIDLNLTAAFLCMQSVGRVMRELGGGIIINVLSPKSEVQKPFPAYEAASAGLDALSRAAEEEFGVHGIQVRMAKSVEEAGRYISTLGNK